MKTIIFTFSFLFFGALTYAQNTIDKNKINNLTKINIAVDGAGIGSDLKLGEKSVLDLSIGMGAAYNISEGSFNSSWDIFNPALFLSANPKFYYNRAKRLKKGKSINYNSGNYVGIRFKYATPTIGISIYERSATLLNAHWGIQRSVGKKWIFNGYAGLGYAQNLDANLGTIYPALNAQFSYIINHKKFNR